MYGTDGTQDVPRKWEGFGEYKLVYRLRNKGLDYLGNDTVVSNTQNCVSMMGAIYRLTLRGHISYASCVDDRPLAALQARPCPSIVVVLDASVHLQLKSCGICLSAQVILKGDQLLQFHMARDSDDAALQYPTRYFAADNFTMEVDIRLNRYIAQMQARRYAHLHEKAESFATPAYNRHLHSFS